MPTRQKIIDIFCHFMPTGYCREIERYKIGDNRMFNMCSQMPSLVSLEQRLDLISELPGYRQVLSIVGPSPEILVPDDRVPSVVQTGNELLAETVRDNPSYFSGFIASLPMANVDSMLDTAERAVTQMGACGVQVPTNIRGRSIDNQEYMGLFELAARMEFPIWLHPVRGQEHSDYPTENYSKYELWWALGWPYETSVSMSRLVFSGVFARWPNLKIIAHHAGGMIPMILGRINAGLKVMGRRTPEHLQDELTKTDIDNAVTHMENFYIDTACFGHQPAIECGLKTFGENHILFASDMPFGLNGGRYILERTIQNINELNVDDFIKTKIFSGNARTILNLRNKEN